MNARTNNEKSPGSDQEQRQSESVFDICIGGTNY